jgi:hypothetical protein
VAVVVTLEAIRRHTKPSRPPRRQGDQQRGAGPTLRVLVVAVKIIKRMNPATTQRVTLAADTQMYYKSTS